MRKTSLLVLALLAVHALADGPAGSVQGTVTDVTSSALPGVTVSITNGKLTRQVTTDGNGHYALDGLPAGGYDVSFDLAGATEPKRERVTVTNSVTNVSVALKIAIIEDVSVSCGPPCNEEPPATQWEYPLCADYAMNTSLIESAGRRDRSAIDLLQRRYAATLSWQERARMAAALLGRIPNDATLWKEIEEHAENYLRFSEDGEEAKLDAWCAERGYDPREYLNATYYWFDAASSDRRSRPLLVRAISSKKNDVVFAAIYGFAYQRG